jgi:hypothetical protein
VRSVLGGLGGFETDDADIFVPDDAAAPAEWPDRLDEILRVQRQYWADLS